jgi:hypothetical protein
MSARKCGPSLIRQKERERGRALALRPTRPRSDLDHSNDPVLIVHDDDFVVVDEVLASAVLGIEFHQHSRHHDQRHGARDDRADADREVDAGDAGTARDHRLTNARALLGGKRRAATTLARLALGRAWRLAVLAALALGALASGLSFSTLRTLLGLALVLALRT